MSTLVQVGLANAGCAAVLALVALVVGRFCRRPAVLHSLWLLVLLKMVTPPLVPLRFAVLPERSVPATTPVSEPQGVNNPPETFIFALLPRSSPAELQQSAPALGPAATFPPVSPKVQEVRVVREASATRDDAPAGTFAETFAPAELPAAPPTEWTPADLLALAGGVWLAGAALWFARAGWHVAGFQRLLRHARPAPAEIQDQACGLAARLGFSRCPEVWLMPGALSPMVWAAVGRVRVFFPAGLLERLDPDGRASLLAHELAHVRRRDHWVRWLEVVVLGLFWWYPLAWFARRQLQAHEEECCDAWVVAEVPPRVYATAILETVDFLAEAAPVLPTLASGLGGVHLIRRRLTRIMDGTNPKHLSAGGRLAVLAVVLGLMPLVPTLARSEKKPQEPAKEAGPETELTPEASTEFRNYAINLAGGNHDVFSLAVSPDGRLLASGSGYWDRPGELKLWDLVSRKVVLDLHETQGVASVVFSPDGKRLATGGYNHLIKVRNVADGRETFVRRLDGVARVAFSPDGKKLAAVSEGKSAFLLDAASGREVVTLQGDLFRFHCVAFSRDGKHLAAGGGNWEQENQSFVAIWDTTSGKQVEKLATNPNPILNIAFSVDGSSLATASVDMTVRLLDARTHKQTAALKGHEGWVEGLAFAADGKTLASGSHDGTVRLWDPARGVELAVMAGHTPPVRSAVFTPDSKTLITGGADRVIRLWDVAGRKEIATLQRGEAQAGGGPAFQGVAFAPDGKSVAVAAENQTAQIRDAVTGELLRVLEGHVDAVTCLAFGDRGKLLVTGSPDRTVRVWTAADGKMKHTLEGHTSWVYSVAFAPDGKTLASGGYDKVVRLWDAAEGKAGLVLKGHTAAVRAVAFSPDGKLLASGGTDRTVRLWDPQTGKGLAVLKGHEAAVRAVVLAPDGKTLFSGDEDGVLKLWDLSGGAESAKEKATWIKNRGEISALSFSPAGNLLASAEGSVVRLWDVATGSVVGDLAQHGDMVTGVAFSPDGRSLVSVSPDRTVKVWHSVPGALRTFRGHTGPVRRAVLSPDGRGVLSCGGWPEGDKTLRQWDVVSGREVRRLIGHKDQVLGVAYSPDGRHAVSGSQDKTLRLWDLSNGKELRVLEGHQDAVCNVAYSLDGKWILSASHDKTVGVWNAETGKRERVLRGHTDWVRCVAFSPDGKRAVSGGRDKTLRLWDLATGEELKRIDNHGEWVETVAFAADGRRVLTGGGKAARLWDVESGKELQTLNGHAFGVTGVAFTPDGKGAWSVSYDGSTRLWDLETGRERHRLSGHREWVWSVDVSADGRRLLTSGGGGSQMGKYVPGNDHAIRLWAVPAQ